MARRKGAAGAIGVSNFTEKHLTKLLEHLAGAGTAAAAAEAKPVYN